MTTNTINALKIEFIIQNTPKTPEFMSFFFSEIEHFENPYFKKNKSK